MEGCKMQYFEHSATASTDSKIMQLRLECGGAAVDAYWYLVEQMHRDEAAVCVGNAGAMRVHCHTLCTDSDTLKTWISAMFSTGLLEPTEDGAGVQSERAMLNIEEYRAKREKASSAAKSRWSNADAKQTHKRTQCKRNADPMPTKQNKTNSSNAIKGITTTSAEGGAAAVKTAPPQRKTPYCPTCESKLFKNTQTGKLTCPGCFDTFTDEQARWR